MPATSVARGRRPSSIPWIVLRLGQFIGRGRRRPATAKPSCMPARSATPSPSGCTAASASARWPTGLPWRSACALLSPRSVETWRIPGIFQVVFRDSNAGATAAPALILGLIETPAKKRQSVLIRPFLYPAGTSVIMELLVSAYPEFELVSRHLQKTRCLKASFLITEPSVIL